MTRDELLERLNSIEWNDIEFKAASWAVPKDALSTVSAFANTTGGHLVFGVEEANGKFSVSGVIEADKVQNDFLGQIRDKNKISVFLPVVGEIHAVDGNRVIAFYVPEAQRSEKPVFLDGNPKNPISAVVGGMTLAPVMNCSVSCGMPPRIVLMQSHWT